MTAVLDFFFAPERPFSLAINLLIMAIGGLALLQIVRAGLLRTRHEEEALSQAKRESRGKNTAEEISALAPGLPENSHIRQRITNLVSLKEVGDEINHEALSALVRVDLEGTAALGRWAASTVVLVGLAGTLIGLTWSVRSADSILRNIGTMGEAVGAVLETFNGIQVAFSTTLMGVLWAAILSFAIVVMRGRQENFLRQLEEFSLVTLIPRFRTSAGLALVESARKLATLEARLDTDLRTVIDEMRLRGLALTTAIDHSFDGLTTEFNERSRELLNDFRALQQRLDMVLGTPGDGVPSLMDNMGKLQRAAEAVHHVSESVQRLVPHLEEAIARQVDQQTRDLNEALASYTNRLGDSIERQDGIFEDGIERISDAIENLKSSIPSLNEALSAHLERHSRAVEGLDDRFGALKTIDEKLDELHGIRRDLEVLSKIANAVEPNHVQAQDIALVREYVAAWGDDLSGIRAQITEANATLKRSVTPARTSAEGTRDHVDSQDGRGGISDQAIQTQDGNAQHAMDGTSPGPWPDDEQGVRGEGRPQRDGHGATTKPRNLWQRWFGH